MNDTVLFMRSGTLHANGCDGAMSCFVFLQARYLIDAEGGIELYDTALEVTPRLLQVIGYGLSNECVFGLSMDEIFVPSLPITIDGTVMSGGWWRLHSDALEEEIAASILRQDAAA